MRLLRPGVLPTFSLLFLLRVRGRSWFPPALSFEHPGQSRKGGLDARAIVRRGDRALGLRDNQLRVLPQRLPSLDGCSLASDDFQSLQETRKNRDIACGILPDLVKGCSQQAREARAASNTRSSP